MKIKLTETQYNRLLTETQQVGDVVTPFVVKMFKLLDNKVKSKEHYTYKHRIENSLHFLMKTMSLPVNVALPITTTYEEFKKEGMTEWDNLIGKPLQNKKVYEFNTSVPVMATMYARGYGDATVYSVGYSEEDALKNVLDNHQYTVELDDEDNIDWDYDIEEVEINEDMMLDDMYEDYPESPGFRLTNSVPTWLLSNLITQ